MSLIYKRVLTYVLDDKLIVNYFFVATDRWTYLTAIHLEAAISYTHTLTYLPLHENLSKSHTHTETRLGMKPPLTSCWLSTGNSKRRH